MSKVTQNRFLLFAGEYYYPAPAWNCFVNAFATVEEASAKGDEKLIDGWWQVVDVTTLKAVAAAGGSYTGKPVPIDQPAGDEPVKP